MDDFQSFVKKHYFWILFAVAILLVPTGWWLGTSSLAAKTKARQAEIEAAMNGIPNPSGHPNDKWTAGMKVVNKKREKHHFVEAKKLFEMQRGTWKWPTAVAHVMADQKFFAEPKGAIANRVRSTYADIYIQEAKRVWEIVRPMKQDKETGKWNEGMVMFGFQEQNSAVGGGGAEGGGPGNIGGLRNTGGLAAKGGGGLEGGGGLTASGVMPRVPDSAWTGRAPTFKEMWRAQLDLWLLEALLKSINRVNEFRGAKSIYDAPIVEIAHISLHGGDRKALEEARKGGTAGGDSESEGGPSSAGAGGTMNSGNMSSGGLLGGNQQGEGGGATPGGGNIEGMGGAGAFGDLPLPNPASIFGPPRPEGGEDAAGDQNSDSESTGGGKMMGPNSVGGEGGAGAQQGVEMSPWVDDDPEMPFKTRGFMLKLLMKRSDVTLLIQELTDARKTRYPIEILWINGVDKDIDHRGDKVVIRYGGNNNAGGAFGEGGVGGIGGVGPMGEGGGPMPGIGGRFGGGQPPFGGKNSGGVAPGGEGAAGGTGALPFQSALQDSSLGYVVIAGLMTVYQEPKKPETDPNDNSNAGANNATNAGDKKSTTKAAGGKTQTKTNPGFIAPKKKDPATKKPAKKNTTGKKSIGDSSPKKKDPDNNSGFKPGNSKPAKKTDGGTGSTTPKKPADTSKPAGKN